MPSDFDVTKMLKTQAEGARANEVRNAAEVASAANSQAGGIKLSQINVSAAYSYLSAITREQGNLSPELARTQSVLQRYVATLASDPERADNASPAPREKPLLNLVGMVVSKDSELQDQLANDLTSRNHVVRTSDAVDELKSYCDTLPRVFQESNEPGRVLMRYLCELVVNLTTADNISPATSRQLARQNIFAPEGVLTSRGAVTLSSLLSATVDFIRSNQPDVIQSLGRNAGRVIAPTAADAQIGEFIQAALEEMPADDDTYLNIFKNGQNFEEDETAERIARRVSALINKAADIARQAHLIDTGDGETPENSSVRELANRQREISREDAEARASTAAYEEECNRKVENLYRSMEETPCKTATEKTSGAAVQENAFGSVPQKTSGTVVGDRVTNIVATKALTDAIIQDTPTTSEPGNQENKASSRNTGNAGNNANIDLIREFENFSLPENGPKTGVPLSTVDAARINSILSDAVARAEQSHLFGESSTEAVKPVIDEAVAQVMRTDDADIKANTSPLTSGEASGKIASSANQPIQSSVVNAAQVGFESELAEEVPVTADKTAGAADLTEAEADLDSAKLAAQNQSQVSKQEQPSVVSENKSSAQEAKLFPENISSQGNAQANALRNTFASWLADDTNEVPTDVSASNAQATDKLNGLANSDMPDFAQELNDIEQESERLRNEVPFTGTEDRKAAVSQDLNSNISSMAANTSANDEVAPAAVTVGELLAREELADETLFPSAPASVSVNGVDLESMTDDASGEAATGNPKALIQAQALKTAQNAFDAEVNAEDFDADVNSESIKANAFLNEVNVNEGEEVASEADSNLASKAQVAPNEVKNTSGDTEVANNASEETAPDFDDLWKPIHPDSSSVSSDGSATVNVNVDAIAATALNENTDNDLLAVTLPEGNDIATRKLDAKIPDIKAPDTKVVDDSGRDLVSPQSALASLAQENLEAGASSEDGATPDVKNEIDNAKSPQEPSWLAGVRRRAQETLRQNAALDKAATGDYSVEAAGTQATSSAQKDSNQAASSIALNQNGSISEKPAGMPHLEIENSEDGDLSAPGLVKLGEQDADEAFETQKPDKVSNVISKRYGTENLGVVDDAMTDSDPVSKNDAKVEGSSDNVARTGIFGRLAGLFRHGKEASGTQANVQDGSVGNVNSGTQAAQSENVSAGEKVLMQPEKAMSLTMDDMVHSLSNIMNDGQATPEIRKMASSIFQAMTNPLGDLQAVSAWLGLVNAPLSASGPRAAAMQQWALMLLSIRFRQLGKSIDKFTKSDAFNRMLAGVKVENGVRWPQEMLDQTMQQIERLQSLSSSGQELGLPSFIPLPPSYPEGREGGVSVERQFTPDGTPEWKLSFFFELPDLGPLQIKSSISGAEVKLQFVAEKPQALARIAETAPVLRERLDDCGFNVTKMTPRLGRVYPPGQQPRVAASPVESLAQRDGLNLNI